jgi:hypothetical protein
MRRPISPVRGKIVNGHPNRQIDDLSPWAYVRPRRSGMWPDDSAYDGHDEVADIPERTHVVGRA